VISETFDVFSIEMVDEETEKKYLKSESNKKIELVIENTIDCTDYYRYILSDENIGRTALLLASVFNKKLLTDVGFLNEDVLALINIIREKLEAEKVLRDNYIKNMTLTQSEVETEVDK